MYSIILGAFAFVLLLIYDFNNSSWHKKFFNIFFGLGFLILVFATCLLYIESEVLFLPYSYSFVMIILSGINLLLILYALFGALPLKKTYIQNSDKKAVVDNGLYALCRHPGVIFFGLFYLFLFLSNLNIMFLLAFVIWTILDIIHVIIQDIYVFPKVIIGYDQYKEHTPFLIPTIKSFKKMVMKGGKDCNDTK